MTTTVVLAKDMAEGATLQSRLKVVDLGLDQDGDPITSCACVPAPDNAGAQAKAQAKTTPEQRRFLDILDIAITDAPAGHKDTTKVPADVQATTREMLKKYCVSEGWMDEAESNKARAKVSGMINTLAGKRLIGATDRYVWRVR